MSSNLRHTLKKIFDAILQGYVVTMGFIYSACRGLVILFLMPTKYLVDKNSRPMVRAWYQRSRQLLWGSLLYNTAALLLIRPLLKFLFPPLSFWEQTQSFFGADTRWTYQELLPFMAPILWGLGNGFIFALLSQKTRAKNSPLPPVSKDRRAVKQKELET